MAASNNPNNAIANKLSPRQWKFCEAYLASDNAAQAYIDAGYCPKNRNFARSQAADLLATPTVADYIARVRQQMQEQYQLNRGALIRHLQDIAYGRIDEEVVAIVGQSKTAKIVKKKPSLRDQKDAAQYLLDYMKKTDELEAVGESGRSTDEVILKALKGRTVKGLPIEKDSTEDEQAATTEPTTAEANNNGGQ